MQKANASSVKVSTRKVRLVADAIRGMSVQDALDTLMLTRKHGSYVLIKTLKSAIANAVNNGKMNKDALVIAKLEVNEGPFLKRFHASTRGRIHGYKKRTSHISIVLKEKEEKKN
ncbi:MAG TPA: 50S ribosomal protein L22 [Patescibacteria group bacterium]|nr:50S ribosomal protein L22 [Patescibacteria group bacterium]